MIYLSWVTTLGLEDLGLGLLYPAVALGDSPLCAEALESALRACFPAALSKLEAFGLFETLGELELVGLENPLELEGLLVPPLKPELLGRELLELLDRDPPEKPELRDDDPPLNPPLLGLPNAASLKHPQANVDHIIKIYANLFISMIPCFLSFS